MGRDLLTKKNLLIFLFCTISMHGISQEEKGLPLIRNYTPQEYQSHRQNWAMTQSRDGIMFIANGKGVLVYDGAYWELIMMPNRGHVRSVAIGHDQKVYVGANNDFGVLQPNEEGKLHFYSFNSKIPDRSKGYGRIWSIGTTRNATYFQSSHHIFHLKDGEIKTWSFEDRIHRLFSIGDEIYISNLGRGLMHLNPNDKFEPAPGGEFARSERIEIMLPFRDHILLSLRGKGLYTYDDGRHKPFQTNAEDYLDHYGLYKACYLHDNRIAFATNKGGGIVVLDQYGKLDQIIDESHGLINSNVLNVFTDQQGGLWVGLQEGLARVEVNSPFFEYDERLGLKGTIQRLVNHQDTLFVASSNGLYKMEAGKNDDLFQHKSGVSAYCWNLLSWNEKLLVSTTRGLFECDKGRANKIPNIERLVAKTIPSSFDTHSILLVMDDGLAQLKWDNSKWILIGKLDGVTGSARDVVEWGNGVYWMKTRSNGLFKVDIPFDPNYNLDFSNAVLEHFDEQRGVPVGENNIFKLGGRLLVRSEDDLLFEYDSVQNSFIAQHKLGDAFQISGGRVLPKQTEDAAGNIWLDHVDEISQTTNLIQATRQLDGSYALKSFPLNQIPKRYTDIYSNEIFYADKNSAWFGGMNGIIQCRLDQLSKEQLKFKVLVKSIFSNDSLLASYFDTTLQPLQLNYAQNNLRVEFAAPFFQSSTDNLYQCKLEGFDKHWSEWTTESKKEYTNLYEGNYIFKVRAKNGYGQVEEAEFVTINIAPPWYRSFLAYALYFLAFAVITVGIVRWRSNKLVIEKEKLEQIVKERTEEVSKQADELSELNRMKSRFFANISHELRTPLTLILGPVGELLQDEEGTQKQKKLVYIKRSAKKLLRLINQLLDLSKIDVGKLELRASLKNIVPVVLGISASFESLARQRGISLNAQSKEDTYELYFDQEKVEQIVSNLISNALKFTAKNGIVNVEIKRIEEPTNDLLSIKVRDSGVGLSQEQVSRVFDRFYQADDSDTKMYEGTGIGLSITRELTELHGGKINLKSKKGAGSTFEVLLPFGSDHLNDDQISILDLSEKLITEPNDFQETENLQDAETLGSRSHQLVLLVEDSEDLRQYISSHLEKHYKVELAVDGQDGWEKAIELVPDLIISDVMMPRMGGMELCKRLKNEEKTSHIPVILLTAKIAEEEKLKGLSLQADEYLIKPFNARELLIRIENLIMLRKKLQKRFADRVIFKPDEIAVSSQEEQFLKKLRKIMEENISNEQYSIEKLGEDMGMSRSQIHRKMQAMTNQTPSQFIRKYRLERSKQLIEKDAGTISDIAYQVGFSSPAYFSKCFMDEYGFSPKEFKKKTSSPSS